MRLMLVVGQCGLRHSYSSPSIVSRLTRGVDSMPSYTWITMLLVQAVAANGISSLHFPVTSYHVTVPASTPSNSPLLQIYPSLSPNEEVSGDITCNLLDQAGSKPAAGPLFYLDGRWIKNAASFKDVDAVGRGSLYRLDVGCRLASSTSSLWDARVPVFINVTRTSSSSCDDVVTDDDLSRTFCFQDGPLSVGLFENVAGTSVASFGDVDRLAPCSGLVRRQYTLSHQEPARVQLFPLDDVIDEAPPFLSIDGQTGEITVSTAFDREDRDSVQYQVRCDVINVTDQRSLYVTSSAIDVTVWDVNDNSPVISIRRSPDVRYREMTRNVSWFTQAQPLSVEDEDDAETSTNSYDVTLVDDDLALFEVDPDLFCIYHLVCQTTLQLVDPVSAVPDGYTFDVVFNDTTFKPAANSTAVYKFTVINSQYTSTTTPATTSIDPLHHPFLRPLEGDAAPTSASVTPTPHPVSPAGALSGEVSSAAALYSRVSIAIPKCSTSCTYIMDPDANGAFDITPNTGILYVKNPQFLSNSDDHNVVINRRSDDGEIIMRAVITVKKSVITSVSCDGQCSRHHASHDCRSDCGVGAVSGRCQWRTGQTGQTKEYAVCSPDLHTCPDYTCDELEMLHPTLCPQDCITSRIRGSLGRLNPRYSPPRGVLSCADTVWCTSPHVCRCTPQNNPTSVDHILNMPTRNSWKTPDGKDKEKNVPIIEKLQDEQEGGRGVRCDFTCRLTVIIVVVVLASVVFLSVVVFYVHRRQRTARVKLATSVVSLGPTPPDITADTAVIPTSALSWPPKITYIAMQPDPKWELAREHLTLGEMLGEGEFGRVVKAEAHQLPGAPASPAPADHTTVAVKMVKENASDSELKDLMSEYNLLKEVSHTNVIKLLAVCSQDGPLWVVVEYCALGCLRSYLRQFRPLRLRSSHDCHVIGDLAGNDLTSKDLLTFCWQIANGMKYLSKMKLVHRDLAARNILLATGKVVKISDFGLTRDIYEEDTYIKRSKCRIPVKWMAPESLYDQVYTSKSDVWSFGVVLWEIVTLGQSPYPGVQHERLFAMLKGGYRMEKPPNCSDKLYGAMLSCWQFAPIQRQTFRELTTTFESMLKENVDYLDLTYALESGFDEDSEHMTDSDNGSMHSQDHSGDIAYGSINLPATNSYLVSTPATTDWPVTDCHDSHHDDVCEKTAFVESQRNVAETECTGTHPTEVDNESDEETLMLQTYQLVTSQ